MSKISSCSDNTQVETHPRILICRFISTVSNSIFSCDLGCECWLILQIQMEKSCKIIFAIKLSSIYWLRESLKNNRTGGLTSGSSAFISNRSTFKSGLPSGLGWIYLLSIDIAKIFYLFIITIIFKYSTRTNVE